MSVIRNADCQLRSSSEQRWDASPPTPSTESERFEELAEAHAEYAELADAYFREGELSDGEDEDDGQLENLACSPATLTVQAASFSSCSWASSQV